MRWKLAAQTKPNFESTCVMRRASCLEQLARFHTAKNGIATRYRFSLWTGPFRGCFQSLGSIFIAGETKIGRAKSTGWSVWQPCFWGCDMTLGTPPAASKVHQKQWNHKRQEGWHKHPCAELGRTAFGSPNSIYNFHTPQKRASNKSSNLICRPEFNIIRLKNTSIYTVNI